MTQISFLNNLVKIPLRELGHPTPEAVKGNQNPTQTYLSDFLVPGCNNYIEWRWIWDIPEPGPEYIPRHVHKDHDEVVIHIGCDHKNPEDLGATIEMGMGDETLIIDKTSAVFVPKGVVHGPLKWTRVDRPHIEMAILLGCGDVREATPGGGAGMLDFGSFGNRDDLGN